MAEKLAPRFKLRPAHWLFLALLVALVPLWPSSSGRAQDAPPAPTAQLEPPPRQPRRPSGTQLPPNERLKVYVLTFTPGDHPFYKFGHNAIWIHDENERVPYKRDLVYNYGMFSFGDPALIPKFFLGRFMYWLDAHGLQGTIAGYKQEGRGIISQELDLTLEQKQELKHLLEENAKDENKYYKYDYYRDNCSTRVRDMIDKVTGGRVKAVSGGPARLNWRQQTSRLTADLFSEYVILNLVMGDLIDKPRTKWEESFIPMEFQQVLRTVTVVGEDGIERPIVKEERTLLEAKLPPPREDPPTFWPYALVTGLLFGGGLAALGRSGVTSRASRGIFGVLLAFFGLLWGFFGWFFLAAWAFTDHAVGYGNENVMLCVPWAFALIGMGINVARSRVKSALRAYKVIYAALISAGVATVVKVLPWFDQDNYFFLLFFVPFWGGAFYGIRELAKKWAIATQLAAVGPLKAAAVVTPAGDSPKKKKAKKPKPVEPAAEKVVDEEAGDAEAKDIVANEPAEDVPAEVPTDPKDEKDPPPVT